MQRSKFNFIDLNTGAKLGINTSFDETNEKKVHVIKQEY